MAGIGTEWPGKFVIGLEQCWCSCRMSWLFESGLGDFDCSNVVVERRVIVAMIQTPEIGWDYDKVTRS